MKKTLMVLSFALCATFVFAQTANMRSSQELKAASKAAAVQTDLNKALFVKGFQDGITQSALKTITVTAPNAPIPSEKIRNL